jgi:dipeptidyl aminopeptidase/acylaminoacyl peptidase
LLAFSSNEDGMLRLRVLDTQSGRELETPELPFGMAMWFHFSPDGSRLGMVINGPQLVGDVYALDLAGGELVRWTHGETGGLKAEDFPVPELIRYETFDEVDGRPRTIPAFYYRPKGEGPFPVLIQIHGGPEGQAHPRFSPAIAHYTGDLGIAVMVPNVRGSSGYGKTYLLLDNGFKREDSVRDIGSLLDWIAARPELDADRVAVTGGSYGGYMVLACMAHYNDRLRAGVELVGISNFVTFLENTQDYRRDLRRVEYGDERDPQMREFLTRISPTTNAARITKPLLVGQGLNDPRVPATESEQMVEIIRRGGGTVAYVLARDEGHGFRKKANRDYFQAAATLFLEQYLL